MFWRTLYCNSKVMFFLCEFWCQVQGKASTNLKISSCCKDCWFAAWSIILGCFEGVNSVHNSESFVTTNHASKVPGAVVDRWGKVISVWSRWNELKRAVGDLVYNRYNRIGLEYQICDRFKELFGAPKLFRHLSETLSTARQTGHPGVQCRKLAVNGDHL